MTSRDFAYWLQGFFEISETDQLTERQVKMIKAHLNLVFKHEIDPSNLDGKTEVQKQEYFEIHRGKKDEDPFTIGKDYDGDIDTTIKPFPVPMKLGGYEEIVDPYRVQLNC